MRIKSKSVEKTAVIVGRLVLVVALVAVVGLVAESQSPQGVGAADAQVAQQAFAGLRRPESTANVAASGDMIGFSHSDGSGTQTITLVHTEKLQMAVYHIDKSGTLRLISSREIDADFSLQLNATSPLPEEIRRLGRR